MSHLYQVSFQFGHVGCEPVEMTVSAARSVHVMLVGVAPALRRLVVYGLIQSCLLVVGSYYARNAVWLLCIPLPAPGVGSRLRPVNREAWRWGIGVWVALRLVSAVAAAYSVSSMPGNGVDVPGYEPPQLSGPAAAVVEPWLRADGLWYMRVATQGYAPDGSLAFFPALPAATAALQPLFGNEAYAALFASNLASLLGLVMLFGFVAKVADRATARAAVAGLALFPTAFFFVAPYGEAMLLFFGSAALLAAVSKRPGTGFVLGAAAALSRPFGVLIALPMAFIVAGQGGSSKRWLAPAGPVAGLAAWMGYTWDLTGDPLGAVRVQSSWQRELTPAWETLRLGFDQWRQYSEQSFGNYVAFDLAVTLFALVLIPATAWVMWRRGKVLLAVGLGLYGAAVMAAPLLMPFRPRALMSNPRFALALFPLFLAYALVPSRARVPLALVSGSGMAVATAVFIAGRPLF